MDGKKSFSNGNGTGSASAGPVSRIITGGKLNECHQLDLS